MPKSDQIALASYIEGLRLPDVARKRFETVIADYQHIMGCDPEFVFVEDAINDDGNREFVTTVMLTRDVWAEGWINHQFNKLYFTSIRARVLHLAFEERLKLTHGLAAEGSRVSVRVDLTNSGYASFGATGHNCQEVMTAIKTFFVPNLINAEGNLIKEGEPGGRADQAPRRRKSARPHNSPPLGD